MKGLSLREIERITGVNRKKVSKQLKEMGYEIKAYGGNSDYNKIERFKLGEQLFTEGRSLKSICKELKITLVSFSRYLKERGYEIKPARALSSKQMRQQELKLDYALKLFNEGYTRTQVARMVKINDNILVHHFNKLGIDTQRSKYHYFFDAFKAIDTPEKAYWLGFLYADGAVIKDRNVIELTLTKKDVSHIKRFRSFLKTNAPITEKVISLNEKNLFSWKDFSIQPKDSIGFNSFRVCSQ